MPLPRCSGKEAACQCRRHTRHRFDPWAQKKMASSSSVLGLPWWLRWWKNLPAMQETCVWSLGWEDPLVKGMATHSSILAWTIPWTEEPGGLQFMGLPRVDHDWVTFTTSFTIQYCCLGKAMNRGAWRAIVHAVTELDTTEQTEQENKLFSGLGMAFISDMYSLLCLEKCLRYSLGVNKVLIG